MSLLSLKTSLCLFALFSETGQKLSHLFGNANAVIHNADAANQPPFPFFKTCFHPDAAGLIVPDTVSDQVVQRP